jgi:hypothetical protein
MKLAMKLFSKIHTQFVNKSLDLGKLQSEFSEDGC